MKIRNGFVSNSSTSSFIVIGVVLKRNEDIQDDYEKYMDRNEYESGKSLLLYAGDADISISEDECVLGYVIADDEELPSKTIRLSELGEIAEKLSERFGVDKSEVKMFVGTRMA